MAMLENVMQHAHEFDILHFHTEFIHFPVVRDLRQRSVTTLHGRADLPDQPVAYETFSDAPLVASRAISRCKAPVGTGPARCTTDCPTTS